MGKNFIGKRIRLQIGEAPTKDDEGVIIGEDVTVHVPTPELDNYSHIIAEKIELTLSGVDGTVRQIMSTIEQSAEARKDEIVSICKQILGEQDKHAKAKHIATLVSIGSGIASIAQFVLQLRSMVGQ